MTRAANFRVPQEIRYSKQAAEIICLLICFEQDYILVSNIVF